MFPCITAWSTEEKDMFFYNESACILQESSKQIHHTYCEYKIFLVFTLCYKKYDRQCTYKVTLERFRLTIFAVEKNKYKIF